MQTDQERRRRAAERSRAYRARKRDEKAAAEAAALASAPTPMRDAVDQSIEAMKWLTDSDGAAVLQARMLADQVDRAAFRGDVDDEIQAHRLLARALAALGGVPTVRMQHELRSARLAMRQGPQLVPAPSGVVSAFKRPEKRRHK